MDKKWAKEMNVISTENTGQAQFKPSGVLTMGFLDQNFFSFFVTQVFRIIVYK